MWTVVSGLVKGHLPDSFDLQVLVLEGGAMERKQQQQPDLAWGCIVWHIILVGAKGSAAASVSIGDCDASGTRRGYPVP
jgi:hypothetical protein